MNTTSEVVRVKEAYAWVEAQKFIHLKAVSPDGKPVQLTAEDARILGERLLKLAKTLASLQSRDDE
jgi:hypothetical protein